MKNMFILVISVFSMSLGLTACSSAAPAALSVRPTQTVQPTESQVPTATLPIPSATPSIALTPYRDEAFGFTFDYPTGWMAEAVPSGDRAGIMYQITSWSHDPGLIANIPAGETDINIVVQRWDPKGDLNAFVDVRKQAWEASGITIEKEEDLTLANANSAQAFVVKGSDGMEGYFMFTTLGENYIMVSGNGDLEKIDIVARSIR